MAEDQTTNAEALIRHLVGRQYLTAAQTHEAALRDRLIERVREAIWNGLAENSNGGYINSEDDIIDVMLNTDGMDKVADAAIGELLAMLDEAMRQPRQFVVATCRGGCGRPVLARGERCGTTECAADAP